MHRFNVVVENAHREIFHRKAWNIPPIFNVRLSLKGTCEINIEKEANKA